MSPVRLSLTERQALFERFVKKYLARGYVFVSQSRTTAELSKPAWFPSWLFRELTLYMDIHEEDRIYVRKA